MTNGVLDPQTNEDWAMVADGTICGPPNSHKVKNSNVLLEPWLE